jgi:hypothetical protein
MQLQDYAEPIARSQNWRTTQDGLTVSGAKTARFTREAVEQPLIGRLTPTFQVRQLNIKLKKRFSSSFEAKAPHFQPYQEWMSARSHQGLL